MKKLSLDLDQLAVDSFDTVGDAAHRAGTVRGHGFTDTTCAQRVCDCPTGSGDTCDDACNTEDCPTAAFGCGSGFHTCVQPSCFYSCPSTCAEGDTCFC
jgi:hypothetical protein